MLLIRIESPQLSHTHTHTHTHTLCNRVSVLKRGRKKYVDGTFSFFLKVGVRVMKWLESVMAMRFEFRLIPNPCYEYTTIYFYINASLSVAQLLQYLVS